MRTLYLFAALATALQPPYGPDHPLVSPDGTRALFGSATAPELWMEDTRTHQRKRVFHVSLQTLTIAWSPDSAAFFLNDRAVSDLEIAYLYDAATLEWIDAGRKILAADSAAARFMPGRGPAADHAYFHALRWIDAQNTEVQLHGHTAGVREGSVIRPGQCFDLRYRVGRDGFVEKLSERIFPVTTNGCG